MAATIGRVSLAALLLPVAAAAANCDNDHIAATAPATEFELHATDGTALHPRTGLMWRRCPLGQHLSNGTTCIGTPQTYSWQQALTAAAESAFAGYDDWRLPSRAELESIVERCRFDPAIETAVFPDASSMLFWSSSPYVEEDVHAAWSVWFQTGEGIYPNTGTAAHVRLVRTPVYQPGDTGPAGGVVFYDKGDYDDGWRYLEAAPAGWNGGQFDPLLNWGCAGTFVGTATGIGAGAANTAALASAACSTPEMPARLAAEASINGYTDWFLPSLEELHAMRDNLSALGNMNTLFGLGAVSYASSSEIDVGGGYAVDFAASGTVEASKSLATLSMRPVRAF